ncbi:MAG: hypothetical protein H0W16_00400 [Actinobacteria bacterium]|nr:hypothetical protein [Actinomycetota bacterium]
MREAEPRRDTRRDPDRPVRPRRDDPGDIARTRQAIDRLLVLGGDEGVLVREREPDRSRIAVRRDHLEVAAGLRGLEQPELGRACP